MTMWCPNLDESERSKYEAIADAIAADVANGALRPGQKLPTQRYLAKKLDVTVGTIGRAYALAEKRGLVSLEVGRGSFIRSFESRTNELNDGQGVIDLGLNLPPSTQQTGLFGRTLARISNSRDVARLFGNAPVESFEHHRSAAAIWLSDRCNSSADNTLICSGTQNALVASLSAVATPGDSVLVEELTFPGMIAAAKFLHLNLIPLEMDKRGIVPAAIRRECHRARVLYSIPSNHNPTTTTMPLARRQEIAKLLVQNDMLLIEDDVYGKLIEDCPTSITSLIPDRSIMISSIAKTVSMGLRLAFVCVPKSIRPKMLGNMRATNFFPSPLLCEVASQLIGEGIADQLLIEYRSTATTRLQIAKEILPEEHLMGNPCGNHVWLRLPVGWSPATIAAAARENGVNVYPASLFVPHDSEVPNAIRISLGAARNESELKVGLNLIARLLNNEMDQPEARY